MSLTTKPLCALSHTRVPWNGGEIVRVFGKWGDLKGTDRRPAAARSAQEALYQAAKTGGDKRAAKSIVDEMAGDDPLDRLLDDAEASMRKRLPVIIVTPTPAFSSPDEIGYGKFGSVTVRNMLGNQFAANLSERIGVGFDTDITQIARVGRTAARGLERFLWQPRFEGNVRKDACYILVDDVLTLGGTFAALRGHILSNGGTICGYAALAHTKGKDQDLAITPKTCDSLKSSFGNDFGAFWSKEIGHDAFFLTEAEGLYLANWLQRYPPRSGTSPLQHLRNRLLEASGQGQRG